MEKMSSILADDSMTLEKKQEEILMVGIVYSLGTCCVICRWRRGPPGIQE